MFDAADAAPAEAMASDVIPELKVLVRHAPGSKCVRGVGTGRRMSGKHSEHPLLCSRCVARLA